jgi:hypothetical protein
VLWQLNQWPEQTAESVISDAKLNSASNATITAAVVPHQNLSRLLLVYRVKSGEYIQAKLKSTLKVISNAVSLVFN